MHRPQNAAQKIIAAFLRKLPALRKQCSQLAQYISDEGNVGSVISIPNEIYSLCGDASMHSRIFVRNEYVRLMRMWNDSSHGFVLVGTPEIGKTHFGALVLLCCLGTTTPVILDNGHPEVLVFGGKSCEYVQYNRLNGMFTARCILIADMFCGLTRRYGKFRFHKVLDIKRSSAQNSTTPLNSK